MEMKPVESSNIAEIGYDSAAKALRIKFKNGGTHEYADVPADAHKALMDAESVGSHFHRNIRGAYLSHKV